MIKIIKILIKNKEEQESLKSENMISITKQSSLNSHNSHKKNNYDVIIDWNKKISITNTDFGIVQKKFYQQKFIKHLGNY